ncbi:sensor histidine kinase [Clostridium polyendosporum]|uniref:histidine kinase n=1 Tax=Clostridium polyendosporum TaxID=69208 RepID=A0A919VKN4_9CLOT|nr:HAMP domain-containing sensor histidine kinase [Clostridium polyendosporum]GIM27768.1 sensor histidine kinase [Clostridium polyendosporum]
MKSFKFKSLTMRIWTTFTAIILIIICSISLIYLVAIRRINENAKIQDLKVAHDILLKSDNFNQPNRFDELRNLKGSDHFIVKIDDSKISKIVGINKRKDYLPHQEKDIPPLPGGNDISMKIWMSSFIKDDNVYQKQFKESYNNIKFLFIISSIEGNTTGKSYLISYMPNMHDNSLLYLVIVIGIIFIAIGFLTAKVVANYISKPLKELEDYTVRIAHKDWKEPIKVKTDDEIGRLVNSMNRMQKELQQADEEEKMFLQSISHDLKTPVMVIMSHAEAIIDGVYIESVEKTAEIIKDEAISLEKKIKQILYLNTLNYVLENNSENIEINLYDLLLHITSRFEVVNSKIEWNLDIDEIIISGNVDKIQVSIENILENGLRYAEEKICVTLKEENSFAVLEIYNDGPNITEEHIDHIFDNLYKDKTGNFGLGLAISKKIIDFYKGEIFAINRYKGVSFIIKFPI